MKLIIGLGNPGGKYVKTRHNIGFRVADELAEKLEIACPVGKQRLSFGGNWKLEIKFKALISESIFNNEKILLAKPQTFMNLSGESVKVLSTYYKIKPQDVWVIHDDIDLPLGTLKISQNVSSAGHKGVQSIINSLGTKDFVRFRIGIKQIANRKSQIAKPQLKTKNLEKFVLEKFSKDEEKIIKQIIKKTTNALLVALEYGIEKAMNEYNC